MMRSMAVLALCATADAFSAFPSAGLALRHGSGTPLALQRTAATQAAPILANTRAARYETPL